MVACKIPPQEMVMEVVQKTCLLMVMLSGVAEVTGRPENITQRIQIMEEPMEIVPLLIYMEAPEVVPDTIQVGVPAEVLFLWRQMEMVHLP